MLLVPALSIAQNQKTVFEENTTFEQAIKKAKQEDKLLLVTYFESTAQEEKNKIFNNRHVAQFLNSNFINLKITAKSSREKSKHTYTAHVSAYPTYVVYDQGGNLVHRVVGEAYPYEFIGKIKKALDPATQYYTMVNDFEAGNRAPEFLKSLVVMAYHAGDKDNGQTFMSAYMNTQNNMLDSVNLHFLLSHTTSSYDPGFSLLLNYPATNSPLNVEPVVERLSTIIFEEEFALFGRQKSKYKCAC